MCHILPFCHCAFPAFSNSPDQFHLSPTGFSSHYLPVCLCTLCQAFQPFLVFMSKCFWTFCLVSWTYSLFLDFWISACSLTELFASLGCSHWFWPSPALPSCKPVDLGFLLLNYSNQFCLRCLHLAPTSCFLYSACANCDINMKVQPVSC